MEKALRPIVKCHGGKWYLRDWIISHFPADYRDRRYIEGCGGGASVLLNKDRSASEVYNDADEALFRLVLVLRWEPFIKVVQDTEYDARVFEWSHSYYGEMADFLNGPLATLIRRRFSRGGLGKDFAWSERTRGGGQPGDVNAWETWKRYHLPRIAERLQGVEVLSMSVAKLIAERDGPDALFYIDPLYLPSTRTARKAYGVVEMTEEDHIELAERLRSARGKVLISGYKSPLYDRLYDGWNVATKEIANHAGQGKVKARRTECLWMNY
jgi:DNA adenine methylase